ncbi:MAG: hypothetical protein ACTSVI_03190 [Promethearchaeota archaeon]
MMIKIGDNEKTIQDYKMQRLKNKPPLSFKKSKAKQGEQLTTSKIRKEKHYYLSNQKILPSFLNALQKQSKNSR